MNPPDDFEAVSGQGQTRGYFAQSLQSAGSPAGLQNAAEINGNPVLV